MATRSNSPASIKEIAAPERIVATECYVEPSVGNPEWLSTVTLEDLGEKTKLTNRVLHPSKEQRDGHVNAGMESGAAETFDRLNEIVTAQATMMERSIEIVRIFDAPRELVYEAWTDPEHMTQWWGPKAFTNHSCKLDVRPGGAWQIVMRSPDGMDFRCEGIYSEVAPPERLVFTNDAVDQNDKPLLKGFTTVIFEEHPGNKTKLTLQTRAEGLVDFAPQMLKGMDQGWSQSFDKLAAHVSAACDWKSPIAASSRILLPSERRMIQTLFGSVEQEPTLLEKLKSGVQKTREGLVSRIEDVVSGRKAIDADLLEELEYTLISADIGVSTTNEILERIRERVDRKLVGDSSELRGLIREYLLEVLQSNDRPLAYVDEPPAVIMVVGVNGAGKTTTIGKLASHFKAEGHTVLLCAADTFRAAAIEQLEVWGERTGIQVIRQNTGSDPSAVMFDALSAAKARQTDYVIIDTAGRLQTKTNLMAELEKMRRTASRIIPDAPHEVLLVLDATTGQNGLEQARKFTESSGVTGIVLTKLDGTAKGGVVVAIARELGLPIRFIGVGEKIDDLLPFDPERFIDSLFAV